MNSFKKKIMLNKLFWNGEYSLYCNSCGSIILILEKGWDKRIIPSDLLFNLRKNFKCCKNCRWLFYVKDSHWKLTRNITRVCYFDTFKDLLRKAKKEVKKRWKYTVLNVEEK